MSADVPASSALGTTPRSNLRAALIVLLSFFLFSGSDALVKMLAIKFIAPQVTFMSTIVALVALFATTAATGRMKALIPRHPALAITRGVLLAADALLIHYAFAVLPLAEAYLLAFLAPVFVAILAFVLLGERLSPVAWAGVLIGFLGVAVALRPGVAPLNLGHAAAAGSALLFAMSLVLLRRAKSTESDSALISTTLVIQIILAFGATLAYGEFQPATSSDLWMAVVTGLLVFAGHALLVRAFRIGDASVVAPFQYSQIIWGCLYGAVLFAAPVEIYTLIGAGIIIVSGWLVLR